MTNRDQVMISSTIDDLGKYRKKVIDVCPRWGLHPLTWEHLSATAKRPIDAALELVERADIYVLIVAHWYGSVPEGSTISATEMEYNRAVERDMERLVFIIDEDFGDWPPKYVEKGPNHQKLVAFKSRLKNEENIIKFFTTVENFEVELVYSLCRLVTEGNHMRAADYDSGLFAIGEGIPIVKSHGLSKAPSEVVVWHRPSLDEEAQSVKVNDAVIRTDNSNISVTLPEGSARGYYRILAWQ